MSNSLTRQHFDAIAEAIASLGGINIRRKMARLLSPVLARFNSSFDGERFRIACKAFTEEEIDERSRME